MINNRKIEFVNFNKLDDETLKLIWKWKTSLEIRTKMCDQRVFSLEEHLEFCSKLKDKKDVLFVLAKCDDVPVGVLTYKDIDPLKHTCSSGCYFVDAPKNFSFLAQKMMGAYLYEQGIYIYHTVVLKNNMQALLFNILKCNNKIIGEDEIYYYLEYDFSKLNEECIQKETDTAVGLIYSNQVQFNI